MIESCGTCRYAARLEADEVLDPGDPANLLCRRYPPQVFTDGDRVVQAWPVVQPSDGCGEHQPTDTAEPEPRHRPVTPPVGGSGPAPLRR